jgi:hypothetical protein
VKQVMTVFCIAMFSLAMLTGCNQENTTNKTETSKPSAQSAQPAPASPAAPAASPSVTGKVVETMDAASYTYVQVDTGKEKIWAAAPHFDVKVGDDVIVPPGMPMPQYHSNTLDRTFDVVYFVQAIMVGGDDKMNAKNPAAQLPASGGAPVVKATNIDLSGIAVAEGGQTVADIFAKKDDLSGKPVKVRGKVVKFNSNIMGKNWIHLQDGTGEAGSNDLTVTTSSSAQVGDTVVISGVLSTDKDFGFGYEYGVLVEDADVKTE